jgi:nitrous oxidase accessory protein NosD
MRLTLAHRVGTACAAAAMATATTAATVPTAAQAAGPTVVRPGESIQRAVDAVPDGATIVVGPGVYAESLTITRPVRLVGLPGTVLIPPTTPPDNLCTRDPEATDGVIPGICIAGTVDRPDAEEPAVTDPVDDVTVTGLSVQGFDLAAIEAYGARRLTLDGIEATDDDGGGVFVAKSSEVRLIRLAIHNTGGRGLDLHDDYRDVVVRDSTFVDNLGEGVFLGSGTQAVIAGNTVIGNCVGIAAVDLGLPGHGGVSHLTVRENQVRHNNRFCAADDEGAPSQSGTGIALVGVVDSLVANNVVTGNAGSADPLRGPATFSLGGIALLDATHVTGGAPPHDDLFRNNVATDNAPFDVLADGSGTDNRFLATTCVTATLPGICTGHADGVGR